MEDCYVYVHTRNDTGRPFYVGKGRDARAWRTCSRNPHWRNIAAKHGHSVHIVAPKLDEELALLAEVELIDKLRRQGCSLANITAGGEGVQLPPEARERRAAAIRAAYKRPEVLEAIRRNARTDKAMAAHRTAMAREDVKAKLREAVAKPVLCVETGQVFGMVIGAADWLRLNGHPRAVAAHISGCCVGRRKSAYGYTWRHAPKV